MKKIFLFSVVLGALSFCLPQVILASCGLAGCPMKQGTATRNHIVDQAVRTTSFDLDGQSGHYWQYEPRYEYWGVPKLIVGGFGSYITLEEGGETHSGFGNPVLFGQYSIYARPDMDVSFGSQLELPFGDDEHGLAAEHTELVPYAIIQNSLRTMHWMGALGARFALNSDDDHEGHHELFVNPHEDKELLVRAHIRFQEIVSHLIPEFFVDGQHALEGEDDGISFFSLGLGAQFLLSPNVSISPKLEWPVTSPRRFEDRFGLNIRCDF